MLKALPSECKTEFFRLIPFSTIDKTIGIYSQQTNSTCGRKHLVPYSKPLSQYPQYRVQDDLPTYIRVCLRSMESKENQIFEVVNRKAFQWTYKIYDNISDPMLKVNWPALGEQWASADINMYNRILSSKAAIPPDKFTLNRSAHYIRYGGTRALINTDTQNTRYKHCIQKLLKNTVWLTLHLDGTLIGLNQCDSHLRPRLLNFRSVCPKMGTWLSLALTAVRNHRSHTSLYPPPPRVRTFSRVLPNTPSPLTLTNWNRCRNAGGRGWQP